MSRTKYFQVKLLKKNKAGQRRDNDFWVPVSGVSEKQALSIARQRCLDFDEDPDLFTVLESSLTQIPPRDFNRLRQDIFNDNF